MADSKEKLFSDFAPTTTEQWMDKVTADLKGADFEKKLVWKTNEGFKVKPFYRMEDLEGLKTTDALPGEFPYLRGTKKDNNEWLVRQEIKVECPKEANTKALDKMCIRDRNNGYPVFGNAQFHIFGGSIFRSDLFGAHLREEQYFLNIRLACH